MSYEIGERFAESILPTSFGTYRCIVYRLPDGQEHVALVMGDVFNQSAVLVRISIGMFDG